MIVRQHKLSDVVVGVLAAQGLSLPVRHVHAVLGTVFDSIAMELKQGHEVKIQGFGHFRVMKTTARQGVNPRTLAPIPIPSKRLAKFKPGRTLKKLLNL
jgi:DNA-binding protein HU-beta